MIASHAAFGTCDPKFRRFEKPLKVETGFAALWEKKLNSGDHGR
jgi:hypothetical protein